VRGCTSIGGYCTGTKCEISTYIAVLPDYKGFDWIFASNIEYEKIFSYVRYYKKRWGIETTFRVQDDAGSRQNR